MKKHEDIEADVIVDGYVCSSFSGESIRSLHCKVCGFSFNASTATTARAIYAAHLDSNQDT